MNTYETRKNIYKKQIFPETGQPAALFTIPN